MLLSVYDFTLVKESFSSLSFMMIRGSVVVWSSVVVGGSVV